MKIPKALLDLNDRFGDALNITLYYRGKIDIRVLDVITAIGFVVFVTYAYFAKGWLAAGQMALMFIFVSMCSLWFFPSGKEMK